VFWRCIAASSVPRKLLVTYTPCTTCSCANLRASATRALVYRSPQCDSSSNMLLLCCFCKYAAAAAALLLHAVVVSAGPRM